MKPTPRARPRNPIGAVALAAIAALTTTAAAAPQSAPGSAFRDQLEVELVNVDVWVADDRGRPVAGLGPGDFTVLHDGEPVAVSYFSEMRDGARVVAPESAAPPEPGAQENQPADEPAHLVVYVDDSRLHPNHLEPLLTALEDLLTSGAVEPQRILMLRQGAGLSVEVPFGSTADEVRAALGRAAAAGGKAGGLSLENESRLVLEAINTAWEESQDAEGAAAAGIALIPDGANPSGQVGGGSPRAVVGGVGSGGGPDACGMFVNQIRPTLDSWARSRAQRLALTLSNLSDGVGFLAGLPGVKMLLYLSDGLDSRPGTDLFTYASTLCPAAGADLAGGSWSEDATRRLQELTRHANSNRVTIHALQASGLTPPMAASAASRAGSRGGASQRASGTFESARRNAERDGMEMIARETGGRAIFDRNDLGPELAKIGEASRSYYSLAYEPPPETGSGSGSHRIEVRMTDSSLVARYRRSYLEKGPEQWLGERVEGALNLGITSNPLAVSLGAGESERLDDGKIRMRLHVLLPAERLTFLPRNGGEWIAEVTVKVLARGVGTDVLALRDQTFRLKGSPTAAGRVGLPLDLELDPGAHLAAIGVRDDGSRTASFLTTMLDAAAE